MFAQVDESGLFLTQTSENTGIPQPDKLFYHPRWTGVKWVEGMKKAQRDALKQQSAYILAKQVVAQAIDTLTVNIDGFTFKANDKSRGRMTDAIEFAKNNNQATAQWRLADGTMQEITLAQLINARDASIMALGALVAPPQ